MTLTRDHANYVYDKVDVQDYTMRYDFGRVANGRRLKTPTLKVLDSAGTKVL